MGPREHDRLTRARGAALLLALLYGLFAGSAFVPIPAQARVQAFGLTLDGHPGVAIAAKSGKAALKAQRSTPDPLLLPTSVAVVSRVAMHPVIERMPDQVILAPSRAAAPYHARAPPTV